MSTLIVRGVDGVDDLARLGLPVASAFQYADTVVLVPDVGSARVVKGVERSVVFMDVDGRMARLALILERVRSAYVERHPSDEHSAHVQVGMFLCYWLAWRSGDRDSPRSVMEALAEGDLESIDEAADLFVGGDFGLGLSGGIVREHGGRAGASGIEPPADAVPSS